MCCYIKKLYFIRHGQTNHNTQRVFQADDVGLNDEGIRQSEEAAKKLAGSIDAVLSSRLERALQTAGIVASAAGCPLVSLDILKEFRNPPAIRGKSYDDLEASRLYERWVGDLMSRQSSVVEGAENYLDLTLRARELLNTLSKRQEDRLAVVTHSELLRAVIAVVILGDGLTPEYVKLFSDAVKIGNGAVIQVQVEYDGPAAGYRLLLNG